MRKVKLNEADLKCQLQSAGYYMGEILKRKIGGCWLDQFYPVSSPTHTLLSEYYRLPNRKFINLEELVVLFYENGAHNSLKKWMGDLLKQGGW